MLRLSLECLDFQFFVKTMRQSGDMAAAARIMRKII